MGRAPLSDNGSANPTADNPDDRLDVYLEDLGSAGLLRLLHARRRLRGAHQVAAYCVLDDDFARSQFGAVPLNSLRVTAAHEFFHAIQFAFDVTEATWFMEGSATWAEDVVYNCDQRQLPVPLQQPDHALAHAARLRRRVLPLRLVHLLQVRLATPRQRRRTPLLGRRDRSTAIGAPQASDSVIGTTAWPAFFTLFASWNTLPAHSYTERAGYPAPAWWHRKTMTGAHATTGLQSVRIPHLASAAVQVTPGQHLSPRKHLLVDRRRAVHLDGLAGACSSVASSTAGSRRR